MDEIDNTPELKKQSSSTMPTIEIDKDIQDNPKICFFINIWKRNSKVLNAVLKQNQTLMKDALKSALYLVPDMFEFENKHYFFRQEVKKLLRAQNQFHESIQVNVDRSNLMQIFEDSFN